MPEPETPATATKRLRGIVTVRFLRLCSEAPSDRPAAVFGRPGALLGALDAPSSRQVVRREGRVFRAQRGARLAVELDGAALLARARS